MTDGKPDMRMIVRVPTTEEGLEVSIPVKSRTDSIIFSKLICSTVEEGGMKATLNDEVLHTVDFSKCVDGIFLRRKKSDYDATIAVRYGNVVYPVPDHEEIQRKFRILNNVVNDIPRKAAGSYSYERTSFQLVMEAPANSISVTPSRESLSMTETTVSTLNTLMTDMIGKLSDDNEEVKKLARDHYRKLIDQAYLSMRPELLLTVDDLTDVSKILQAEQPNYSKITSPSQLAMAYLFGNYHNGFGLKNQLTKEQLESVVNSTFPNRDALKRFVNSDVSYPINSGIVLNKVFIRPLVKKMAKNPVLLSGKLLIHHPYVEYGSRTTFLAFDKTDILSRTACTTLLCKTIFVTWSRKLFNDNLDEMRELGPKKATNHWVYAASRKVGCKEAAISFFKSQGFHVVDVEEHVAPMPVAYSSTPKAPAKPRLKGLASIRNLITSTNHFKYNGHLEAERLDVSSVILAENPECLFLPHSMSDQVFFRLGDVFGYSIVRLIGDKGAIAKTSRQYDKKREEMNLLDGHQYLTNLVCKMIRDNTETFEYIALLERCVKSSNVLELCQLARQSKKIARALKLPGTPEKLENDCLKVFLEMRKECRRGYNTSEWCKTVLALDQEIRVHDTKRSADEVSRIQHLNKAGIFGGLNLEKISYIFEHSLDENVKSFYEAIIVKALKTKNKENP